MKKGWQHLLVAVGRALGSVSAESRDGFVDERRRGRWFIELS